MKPKGNPNPNSSREQDDLPGYPHHGAKEDIYNNGREMENIDPERPDREKKPNEPAKLNKEGDLDDFNEPEEALSRGERTGDDLDVPGAELDDDMEELGSEDEENNYYSLGGDNHEA